MSVSIKVSIRCRPFTCDDKLGVVMTQNGEEEGDVELINSTYSTTRFPFSYAWWSAYGYKRHIQGDALQADNMTLVDQQMAYESVGRKIKADLMGGNAVVLFAYGLSGSGKTFTVFGVGIPDAVDIPEAWFKHEEPHPLWGIFPRLAYELFKEKQDGWKISMKYFQNVVDTVRDLMSPVAQEQQYKSGMRKDPDGFTDIDWCQSVVLKDWNDLRRTFMAANAKKAIAPTQFNHQSTRGHCIMTLEVEKPDPEREGMKQRGRVYVCDLAGTEPAGDIVYADYKKVVFENGEIEHKYLGPHPDASKSKELQDQGKKINLSLTEMAQFFMKMAEAVKANKLKPGMSIPGCNSYFLCKYLKDTMLQARTYLFCAIRPEVKFHGYTFSTLGFAKNASVIKLQPKKASTAASPAERKLMAELEQMKALVSQLKDENERIAKVRSVSAGSSAEGGESAEVSGGDDSASAQVAQLAELLNQKQKELENVLSGGGAGEVIRNGKKIEKNARIQLVPYDRVVIGNELMLFVYPGREPDGEPPSADTAAAEYKEALQTVDTSAMNELQEQMKKFEEEKARWEKERLEREAAAAEAAAAAAIAASANNAANSAAAEAAAAEAAAAAAKAEEEARLAAEKQRELLARQVNDQELREVLPKIAELTQIVKFLNRDVLSFETALQSSSMEDKDGNGATGIPKVKVKVYNKATDETIFLDVFEFVKAHALLKDEVAFLRNALMNDREYESPAGHDPITLLFDNSFHIGSATTFLEYLLYNLETEPDESQLSIKLAVPPFNTIGILQVIWIPLSSPDPEKHNEDDLMDVESPSDLLGKPWTFKIRIVGATGLPIITDLAYCQYEFLGELFTTESVEQNTRSPVFNYEFIHHVDCVTEQFIEYLQSARLEFQVFVNPYILDPPKDKISTKNPAIAAQLSEGHAAICRCTTSSEATSRNWCPNSMEDKQDVVVAREAAARSKSMLPRVQVEDIQFEIDHEVPPRRQTISTQLPPSSAAGGRKGFSNSMSTGTPLKILIASWNVGNTMPPKDSKLLNEWIPEGGGDFDVIALGLQESTYKSEKISENLVRADSLHTSNAKADEQDVEENETDPPTLNSVLDATEVDDVEEEDEMEEEESETKTDYPGDKTKRRGSLDLSSTDENSSPSSEAMRTARVGSTETSNSSTIDASKSSDVIVKRSRTKKSMRKMTRMCATILGAQFGQKNVSIDHQFDHCFWFGDLNYRLDLSYSAPRQRNHEKHCAEVMTLVRAKKWVTLNQNDQLKHQVEDKKALTGWELPPALFPPTFKRVRHTLDEYLLERVPSYCDRVLYKSLPGLRGNLKLQRFSCFEAIATSDHKPVAAAFQVGQTPHINSGSTENSTLVEISDLTGKSLLGLDLAGLSDPWRDDQVPKLHVLCDNERDVKHVHLTLVVMDYDATSKDDLMGVASVSLDKFCQSRPRFIPFEVPVVLNGKAAGTLTGKIRITLPGQDTPLPEETGPQLIRVAGCHCTLS
ncbi:Transcription initiation factor TFIID subunit 13 [Phytophthora nicotianae]|uniref:Transcription initiation factor TFIID subunit 13 n=1 Tax=Phytophthora nicotianae TaxID=4792 RepID=A0A0W8DLN6_PHYNI|nr:Transcription initiation factor TFIID subunit 13 [Phytophthora nicotianae]